MNGRAIFLLPPFKKSGLGHFYRSLVLQLENQPKDSLKLFFPFKNKKLVKIQNEIHPCAHIISSKKFINFVSDEKKTTLILDISTLLTFKYIRYYQKLLFEAKKYDVRIIMIDSIGEEAFCLFFQNLFTDLVVPYAVDEKSLSDHFLACKNVLHGSDFVVLNKSSFYTESGALANLKKRKSEHVYKIGIKLWGVTFEETKRLCEILSKFIGAKKIELQVYLASENNSQNRKTLHNILKKKSNLKIIFSQEHFHQIKTNTLCDYWFVGSGLTKYEAYENKLEFCVVLSSEEKFTMNKGFQTLSGSDHLKLYNPKQSGSFQCNFL